MSHSFSAAQNTILGNDSKQISWLFEIGSTPDYRWSLEEVTYSGNTYTAKVVPGSFSGVKVVRSKSEHGVQTSSGGSIVVANAGNALAESDFQSGGVFKQIIIKLLLDNTLFTTYLFKIYRVDDLHEQLVIYYEDYLTSYLEGTWPNTPLFTSIAPDDTTTSDYCVPIVFGTAYIPCSSLFISGDDRYYILSAAADGSSWTISEVRPPRDWSSTSTWTSTDFTFTDSEKTIDGTAYRVFQPMVALAADGSATQAGLWKSGTKFLPPLVKYSVGGGTPDLSAMTDFDDVLEYILEDMGVPSANIDTGGGSTFEAAQTSITSAGLSFNYGFYQHQDRKKIIANMLSAFNCYLSITDKVELHFYDSSSQGTLTSADIVDFQVSGVQKQTIYDGAYVAFAESGEPQDELTEYPCAADGSSYTNLSTDTLEIPYYTDDQKAQRACELWQQRKFYPGKKYKLETKMTGIKYMPDDTITINDTRYGGNYTALVDTVHIDKEGHTYLIISKLETAIEDWSDSTPGNVAFVADDSTNPFTPPEETCLPTDEDLLGYWPLDDGPNAAYAFDRSKNQNHGTMTDLDAAGDWVQGISGRCPDFDGTTERISIADVDEHDSIKTYSCWFYPTSYQTDATYYHVIVGKHASFEHGLYINYNENPNRICAYFEDSDGDTSYCQYILPAYAEWYHVVSRFNPTTKKTELFINGELEDVASSAIDNTDGDGTSMSGATLDIGGKSGGRLTVGRIAQVRVYDRALTDAEIRGLYKYPSGNTAQVDGTQWVIENGLTIASGGLILNGAGYMKTTGKAAYDDATAGVFLGYDDQYCIGITDGTSYFHFGVSDGLDIKVGSGDKIDIDGDINVKDGGDITVEAGGDIIMQSSSGDESEIIFENQTYDFTVRTDYTLNGLLVYPSTHANGYFLIGKTQVTSPWSVLDYTAPNIVNIASSSLTAIESVQTTNENRGLCQVNVGTDSASAALSAATDYDTYVASFAVYSDEGDAEAYGEFTGDYFDLGGAYLTDACNVVLTKTDEKTTLRNIQLLIEQNATATEIDCTLSDRYNAHGSLYTTKVTDLAPGDSDSYYAVSSGFGLTITIKPGALGDDAVAVLAAVAHGNSGIAAGVDPVMVVNGSNQIELSFKDKDGTFEAPAAFSGAMFVDITYLGVPS